MRGWELRKELGPEFPEVLEALDTYLRDLDLKVTRVFDEPELVSGEPTREQLMEARYYITLRGTMTPKTAKMCGAAVNSIRTGLSGLPFTHALPSLIAGSRKRNGMPSRRRRP